MEVSLLAFLLQGNHASGLQALTQTFAVSALIVGLDILLKVSLAPNMHANACILFATGLPLQLYYGCYLIDLLLHMVLSGNLSIWI